jgi:hypothetical protein
MAAAVKFMMLPWQCLLLAISIAAVTIMWHSSFRKLEAQAGCDDCNCAAHHHLQQQQQRQQQQQQQHQPATCTNQPAVATQCSWSCGLTAMVMVQACYLTYRQLHVSCVVWTSSRAVRLVAIAMQILVLLTWCANPRKFKSSIAAVQQWARACHAWLLLCCAGVAAPVTPAKEMHHMTAISTPVSYCD